MRSNTILLCLLIIRCASLPASNPVAASVPAEEGALPASFAASQPASRPGLTVNEGIERTTPRATRYVGRLWTPCPEGVPFAACLTTPQVREIWQRFGEDQARFQRAVIDALKERDKMGALVGAERAARLRAVLGAILGTTAALLTGVGLGFLIEHFLPQR